MQQAKFLQKLKDLLGAHLAAKRELLFRKVLDGPVMRVGHVSICAGDAGRLAIRGYAHHDRFLLRIPRPDTRARGRAASLCVSVSTRYSPAASMTPGRSAPAGSSSTSRNPASTRC